MRSSAALGGVAVAATAAVLAPQIALATDPALVPTPTFMAGDTWVYDQTHETAKGGFAQQRIDVRIERVDSDKMLVGLKLDGSPAEFEDRLMGLDLSERRVVDGQSAITQRDFSFPLKIGATWEEDFVDPRRQGAQTSAHVQRTYRVVGWEDVTVPAGTFHALKIEANGKLTAQISLPATAVSAAAASPLAGTSISHTERARSGVVTQPTYRVIYYAPEIKSYVKAISEQYDSENVRTKRDVSVLASFKPGR